MAGDPNEIVCHYEPELELLDYFLALGDPPRIVQAMNTRVGSDEVRSRWRTINSACWTSWGGATLSHPSRVEHQI